LVDATTGMKLVSPSHRGTIVPYVHSEVEAVRLQFFLKNHDTELRKREAVGYLIIREVFERCDMAKRSQKQVSIVVGVSVEHHKRLRTSIENEDFFVFA